MAYAYSINSLFKPFSYAELLAPVLASTEAHLKVEDEYTVLSAQAETLREKAMQESVLNPDSKWAKKYMAYADKLEQSAADLAKYGLRPSTRLLIFQAKKDYYNSVDPAIKAIEQLKKLSDALYALNPALRMVYGDMPTVDELIADPTKKPVAYSGSDVYTQAATSAKMASARNIIKDAIEKSKEHPGYYDMIKEIGYNGITPDNILDKSDLKAIYEIIEKQFGNFEGVSEANKEKLKLEALKGVFDGVMYDKKSEMVYDQYAAETRKLQHALNMYNLTKKDAEEAARQAALKEKIGKITPQAIIDLRRYDLDAANIRAYQMYFKLDKDGNWYLTPEGWLEYKRTQQISGPGAVSYKESSPFKAFVDNLYKEGKVSYRPHDIANRFNKLKEEHANALKWDATKLTEYAYNIDGAEQEDWAQRISEASNNKPLRIQEWDSKTKKWKTTDTIDINEAFKDNAKITSIQVSPYGITFKTVDENKKTLRYELPAGINTAAQKNLKATLSALQDVQNLYASSGESGTVPLNEDIRKALVKYGYYDYYEVPSTVSKYTLQSIAASLEGLTMDYISQLNITNSTET